MTWSSGSGSTCCRRNEWLAPVSGAPDAPASGQLGQLPPQRFHRTDRGVFACVAMGNRVAVMTYELDSSAREQRSDDAAERHL